MRNREVLVQLMDAKVVAILRVLFNAKDEFYLRELAKKAKVPVTSALRELNELVGLDVVAVKQIKRMKLYSIGSGEKAQTLAPLFRKDIQVVEEFVDKISGIPGLQAVYVQGQEKDRANLLLVGVELDQEVLTQAVADIKENQQFTISYLPVTLEQYKQMSTMGMWSEQKKLVWERGYGG
jgi:hypothetical protein